MSYIYWFTGNYGAGKTVIGSKLREFLQTEKRNWRKTVFYIDEAELRIITNNIDYSVAGNTKLVIDTQLITKFLHNNNCDVIVTATSPNLNLREEFKAEMQDSIVEIYVHTVRKRKMDELKVNFYEAPQSNFVDMDTTYDNPAQSFSNLITHLKSVNKL